MNHCKDCKWWTGSGKCELTKYDGDPIHPESLAVAHDGEMYYAALYTDPDFGCVQFSPKE